MLVYFLGFLSGIVATFAACIALYRHRKPVDAPRDLVEPTPTVFIHFKNLPARITAEEVARRGSDRRRDWRHA